MWIWMKNQLKESSKCSNLQELKQEVIRFLHLCYFCVCERTFFCTTGQIYCRRLYFNFDFHKLINRMLIADCPDEWVMWSGSCYFYMPHPQTWSHALDTCSRLGRCYIYYYYGVYRSVITLVFF